MEMQSPWLVSVLRHTVVHNIARHDKRATNSTGEMTVLVVMQASVLVYSSIIALLFLRAVQAAECASEVASFDVSTADGADELVHSLMCIGSTHVTVDWHGWVKLTQTIAVGNGSSLSINGLEEAVIDGGSAIPLITVSGGATLKLNNISLENGWAADQGGAVFVNESYIALDSCRFSGNNATIDGGESEGCL